MEPGSRHKIAVVSGSYGAGHDAVARELAGRLLRSGADVSSHDIAGLLACHAGQFLRWAYLRQLRTIPSTWGPTLARFDSDNEASRTSRSLLSRLGSRLLREVSEADLVVSTHPFASQILGAARTHGLLAAPVVTYLTDASVHRLWVNPGIDLHLAIHEVAASQARALGADVVVVNPLVPSLPGPVVPHDWCAPWPAGEHVALIVGGSCGLGQLHAAAKDVQASGLMTPVVACGSNNRLRRRVGRLPGTVALGWRSDLRALMAAADCVIQNAGGMSSLEALTTGTPTLTYRPIPGHGLTNALALDQAGLVPFLEDASALTASLSDVLAGGGRRWLPDLAEDCLETLAGLLPDGTSLPPKVAA